MPFIRSNEAVVHDIHGARFTSYVIPATGSRDLAAWRAEIPAGTVTPAHVISHEEAFYILSGRLQLTINGETAELNDGDAAVAPAGSALAVANTTDKPAQMWVTTRAGLSATMADGSTLTPPWAN
ncbi:cupin domain-containing protein [Streptomyces pinistramenti]|uniref:cupin domain-containing protein n=1 Tax=Streptomyces pinistramenti TaxID=2884812 RepID=UPI001D06A6B8|nr:cupin domain-containing protein [Streptomyces pinistramenti]MCB5910037.1 cupin domain-containing protein [Streptomyces pinistramenti]